MFRFRIMQRNAPKETESDRQRVEREGHEVSKKLLEYYCSNIGFLPRDVQPYLEGYRACKKVWKGMSMRHHIQTIQRPKDPAHNHLAGLSHVGRGNGQDRQDGPCRCGCLHKEGKQGPAHSLCSCFTLQGPSRAPVLEGEGEIASVCRSTRSLPKAASSTWLVTGATCVRSRGKLELGAN
jgi:hypothetical protein